MQEGFLKVDVPYKKNLFSDCRTVQNGFTLIQTSKYLCKPIECKDLCRTLWLWSHLHITQAWTDPSSSLQLRADRQICSCYSCFLQHFKELVFKLSLDLTLLLVASFSHANLLSIFTRQLAFYCPVKVAYMKKGRCDERKTCRPHRSWWVGWYNQFLVIRLDASFKMSQPQLLHK